MRRKDGILMSQVLSGLRKIYRPPKSFLTHANPFQLLLATILSARSTDAQINKLTPALFRRFPTPAALAEASQEEVEQAVFSSGTYRTKARAIRALARILALEHGGQVPRTMEELTRLPGVGRKTASIILHVAFGRNEGIAVDTHVFRLARRLGLSTGRTPEQVERDLMAQTPRGEWGDLNPLMISHGRAVCTARGRMCGACIFKEDCPSSLVRGLSDKAVLYKK